MHSSTTALLWAVPSLDPTQKQPVQPARTPATSVPQGLVPQHFVVAQQTKSEVQFGAFRSDEFALRADQARTIAMQELPEQFSKLPFPEAVKIWLEEEEIYHADKPKTMKSYRDYVKRLNQVFRMPLNEIHIGHIREYQRLRKGAYHARSINNDISLLSRILVKAGLWKPLDDLYRPLPVPRWTPPRVLTEKEEHHLFEVAAKNPDYELAYWVASLTNNTSASGSELRGLKIKNIDMGAKPPILYVPSDKVKNEYRARVIPLNERGWTQLDRILGRAGRIGSKLPDHYIFPLRTRSGKNPEYDPTRPASESFLRKQWDKMRQEAGFPWLRPHDLRHQIITKLLENGIPEQTVMSIAGHVSREMLEHYSHQRVDAKMRALDIIDPDKRRNPQSERIAPAKNVGGRK
jgi:integrase